MTRGKSRVLVYISLNLYIAYINEYQGDILTSLEYNLKALDIAVTEKQKANEEIGKSHIGKGLKG